MSKKTKAEKIAAALRAQRLALQASYGTTPTANTEVESRVNSPHVETVLHKTQKHQVARDIDVYEPKDLRKTIVVTLFVVALLALIYVFQYKGYF